MQFPKPSSSVKAVRIGDITVDFTDQGTSIPLSLSSVVLAEYQSTGSYVTVFRGGRARLLLRRDSVLAISLLPHHDGFETRYVLGGGHGCESVVSRSKPDIAEVVWMLFSGEYVLFPFGDLGAVGVLPGALGYDMDFGNPLVIPINDAATRGKRLVEVPVGAYPETQRWHLAACETAVGLLQGRTWAGRPIVPERRVFDGERLRDRRMPEPPGLPASPGDWVSLDIDTASGTDPTTTCRIAIAAVSGSIVTDSGAWLVQPPGNRYGGIGSDRNSSYHGITFDMTIAAGPFRTVWPLASAYLDGATVLLYGAPFEQSVIAAAVEGLTIPAVRFPYIDVLEMARQAFPGYRSHSRDSMSRALGIPYDKHRHQSGAEACVGIALACMREIGASSIGDAATRLIGGPRQFAVER